MVPSRLRKTDVPSHGGTWRHSTGTTPLPFAKLKMNSEALSFGFVPVVGQGAEMADSSPKSGDFDPKSGLPPATNASE